jgi:hypothetical protein
MSGLMLASLQMVAGIALIVSVAYAAQKLRRGVRAGLPHPSLALAVALGGLNGLLVVLSHLTLLEWRVLGVIGFSSSVLGLIGAIFALVHLYWRAWSALDHAAASESVR